MGSVVIIAIVFVAEVLRKASSGVNLRALIAGGMLVSSSATAASRWWCIALFGSCGDFFCSCGVDRVTVFLLL